MIVAHTIHECRAARSSLGQLALVPTMGALHAGHLSLIERGRSVAPRVAVSIFVNPTQFGPNEDFHRYPRPLEKDLDLCRDADVDLVFAPGVDEMYPPGVPQASIELPALTTTLEGAHRPGHFAGVCQVVAKLFNVVTPQAACFGEKDFQQLAVLRAMTRALDFDIDVVDCPTLRDPDGLAMSSRNRYLSSEERERALVINRSLKAVAERAKSGHRNVAELRAWLCNVLAEGDAKVKTKLDYAAIVDRADLSEATSLDRPAQALVAMRVGNTRLIDNIAIDGSVTQRNAATKDH